MDFTDNFESFLESRGIAFVKPQPLRYLFPDKGVAIETVPTNNFIQPVRRDNSTIFLYEDVWFRGGDTIQKRVLAHLGEFRSIFARKCEVRQLDTPEVAPFFNSYHTYCSARSKYRFGLFHNEELVAAASFSSGRPMTRGDKTLESFEWVRYASLPDTRISGGMGKLLQAFADTVHPDEVMSYADLEWSSGEVYRQLGFIEAGRRAPVEFCIDQKEWRRISVSKIATDRSCRDLDISSFPHIFNLGSIKYLKRFDL